MQLALLTVVCLSGALAQYDDLSVLEEVLSRTSMRPIIRQIPSQGTTLPAVKEEASSESSSVETVAPSSSAPTTEEVAVTSTTAEQTSSSTQEPTSEVTEPTEPATEAPSTTSTTTTELPAVSETTLFPSVEETTDESMDMLFMGMKRPDLATIYRRLFPFRH